jgi:hypothetical protein
MSFRRNNRGRKTSADCERHFRVRLLQRYGLSVGDRYRELCEDIRQGRAQFVDKESNTRTHYTMVIDGQDVRVVYDKLRGALVTALPRA